MGGSPKLAVSDLQHSVRRKKTLGERGSYGGLTRPKNQEREAAKTARRMMVGDGCGGARAKRGCGLLGKKTVRRMR